jgi:glycopeptide antibiotics resistance protein
VTALLRALEPSDYRAALVILVALPLAWRLARARRHGAAQTVWAAALVAVTVPFGDLHAHTHWAKVAWVPFFSRPVKIADNVANVLLYVPLGWLARAGASRSRTLRRAAMSGAALSLLVELSQVFSHGRIPSTTDVACNALGALLGAYLQSPGASRQSPVGD